MAASFDLSVIAELTGLGKVETFTEKFSETSTPTRALYHYAILNTTNTAQALELGDVATIDLLVLKCVANDVDLDLDYVSAFDADLTVQEGEVCVIPTPAGIVYFKNNDTDELSTIEYLLIGR